MKTSRVNFLLNSTLNTNILIQLALVFCLLCNALVAHATEETPSSNQESTTSTEINKVDINTANAELLSSILKGIGLKKATAIVEYREAYGPFHHIDELSSVSGIGKATIQKNAHVIAIK
jgi:competence protein ComEA